jgi:hypothetical protein
MAAGGMFFGLAEAVFSVGLFILFFSRFTTGSWQINL